MPWLEDDEGVVEGRAEHDHLVEARTAIDADRRIHRIVDDVGAVAAIDFGIPLLRQVECHERTDRKLVVARLAFEPQLGLAVIHVERVSARAAEDGRRIGDPGADIGDAVERAAQSRLMRNRRVDRIERRLRQHVTHRIE